MYPEDSIQHYIEPWWIKDEDNFFKRGQLIQAFIPHVDQIPYTLIPVGRSESTVHNTANYQIEPLRIKQKRTSSKLPVAALPEYAGEVYTVFRAKKRPAVIVSIGGPEIPKNMTLGKPKWQTCPTILVAPYYGATISTSRSGYSPELISRFRRCEYPHFIWDQLPLPGETKESILRLDQIQPIGKHHDSIIQTGFCLSQDALGVLDEWLDWLLYGDLLAGGVLDDFRKDLPKIESIT